MSGVDETYGCPACSSVGDFHTHTFEVPAVCVHDDGFEHPSDGTLPCAARGVVGADPKGSGGCDNATSNWRNQ